MLTTPCNHTPLDVMALFAPVAQYKCIGLAVSGGADSLALMLLAQQWAGQLINAPRIIVYTLDHGLRSEATQETAMVQRYAAELGLSSRALMWDGVKPKSGIQAAARKARYNLIGAAMQQDGAEILLTAHHGDDQAETLLMRMAHGSGLKGLGGMRAETLVEGVPVFRPLLHVAKAELEAKVVANGWQWASDPSNDDPHYERVRWRHILSQLSQLGLGPSVFAGLAKRLNRAELALDAVTDDVFLAIGSVDNFGVVRLRADAFWVLNAEIQVRLVQKSLRRVGDQRKPYALAQIEQLVSSLNSKEFAPKTLLGCRVSLHNGWVVIAREAGRMTKEEVKIAAGAQLEWDGRFIIETRTETPVLVQPAKNFSKRQLAEKLGHDDFRMADIGGAPVVANENGQVLALGTHIFDELIQVRFC